MDCPKCGYAMTPFELDCPRCARIIAEVSAEPVAVATPEPLSPFATSAPQVDDLAIDYQSAATTAGPQPVPVISDAEPQPSPVTPVTTIAPGLHPCPSCGKDVSTLAASCPQCGHPFHTERVSQPASTVGPNLAAAKSFALALSMVGILPLLGSVGYFSGGGPYNWAFGCLLIGIACLVPAIRLFGIIDGNTIRNMIDDPAANRRDDVERQVSTGSVLQPPAGDEGPGAPITKTVNNITYTVHDVRRRL